VAEQILWFPAIGISVSATFAAIAPGHTCSCRFNTNQASSAETSSDIPIPIRKEGPITPEISTNNGGDTSEVTPRTDATVYEAPAASGDQSGSVVSPSDPDRSFCDRDNGDSDLADSARGSGSGTPQFRFFTLYPRPRPSLAARFRALRTLEEIARGGMGVIYKANNSRLVVAR